MKGFKATDENMQCRGYQFELGKWHEHEGELKECLSGFHFCDHMPGVWQYYSAPSTRVFEIEAEGVLSEELQCGTDVKRVCRRIRLVREIEIRPSGDRNSGDRNSGDRNSGDCNSGDRNSGDRNSGDCNSGDCNSGNCNSGYRNSGYRNSGDRNSGDRNSGYRDSGDCNSGDRNSGDRNSGDRNSGDRNSGYRNSGDCNSGNYNSGDCNSGDCNSGNCNSGDRNSGYRNSGDCNSGNYNSGNYNSGDCNATDHCAGYFCIAEQPVICFDAPVEMSHAEFKEKFIDMMYELSDLLIKAMPIDFDKFSTLPNITAEKLKALHEKHLEIRKAE